MAQNDFTEDKATLFGAGMVTVGVFGKTALIYLSSCGYLYRFSLCWGRVDKSFRQAKLVVKFITGTINSFPDSAYMSCGIGND